MVKTRKQSLPTPPTEREKCLMEIDKATAKVSSRNLIVLLEYIQKILELEKKYRDEANKIVSTFD